MAERLADVVTQIQNVRQLEAVVTAMRGIAASRAQKGRSLLAGIDAYTDVISRAIGQALSLLPIGYSHRAPLRRAKPASSCFVQSKVLLEPSASVSSTRRQTISAVQPAWSSGRRGVAVANERGIKPDLVGSDGHARRGDSGFREPAG